MFSLCVVFTACPGGGNDVTDIDSHTSYDDNGDDYQGNNDGTASSFRGSGTQSDPYLISGTTELRKLAKDVNGGNTYKSCYFKMTSNITFNNSVLNSKGLLNSRNNDFEEWTPIGNSSRNSFCGFFDGNGYSISGLYINRGSDDNQGLFGFLSGEVKNLTVKDSYIKGNHYCGGIAGSVVTFTNNPKLKNCINYSCVEGAYRSGGILGGSDGSSCEVDRCINYGVVEGSLILGGIVGSGDKTIITNCVNYGTVGYVSNGDKNAATMGGIVGSSSEYGGLEIKNCANFGDVTSSVQSCCGICCHNSNSIENCVNYGSVHFGILMTASYRKNIVNTYYLNISSGSGKGSNDTKITNSQCKSMKGTEMQRQSFLDELNNNAKALGSSFAKWKFGSDGFPTLDI